MNTYNMCRFGVSIVLQLYELLLKSMKAHINGQINIRLKLQIENRKFIPRVQLLTRKLSTFMMSVWNNWNLDAFSFGCVRSWVGLWIDHGKTGQQKPYHYTVKGNWLVSFFVLSLTLVMWNYISNKYIL